MPSDHNALIVINLDVGYCLNLLVFYRDRDPLNTSWYYLCTKNAKISAVSLQF